MRITETYTLNAQDTLQCIDISSACMDSLKHQNIEAALSMIHVVKNDTLYPLYMDQKKKMASKFELFPVLEYKMLALSFDESIGNSVQFRVKFAENAYINMQFNLIKINGSWFLYINE